MDVAGVKHSHFHIRPITTADDLDAVARLRYQVYVNELGRRPEGCDDDLQRLQDPEDAYSIVLAAFDPGRAEEGRQRVAAALRRWLPTLGSVAPPPPSAGVGRLYPGVRGLAQSYDDARFALELFPELERTELHRAVEDLDSLPRPKPLGRPRATARLWLQSTRAWDRPVQELAAHRPTDKVPGARRGDPGRARRPRADLHVAPPTGARSLRSRPCLLDR